MSAASVLFKHAKQLRGGRKFSQFVRECREDGKLDFRDVKIAEVAKLGFGEDFGTGLERFSRRQGWVSEATEATDASAFRDVISTMSVASMNDGYTQAASPVRDKFGTFELPNQVSGEHTYHFKRVALDNVQAVAPAAEYPRGAFGGYKITIPEPVKYGQVAVLAIETVKENNGRQFLDDAAGVGRAVGTHQVRAMLRVALGILNNYKRNGTTFNTYLTAGAWVNSVVDFNIANGPQEFDRLNQLFTQMLDPVTGDPVSIVPDEILATPARVFQIQSVINATELRTTSGATTTVGVNPMSGTAWKLSSDPYVRALLINELGLTAAQADSLFLYGKLTEAFKMREVEPFKVFETTDAQIGYPDFFQDIVYAAKGRWWGVPYVHDPMKVVRARAA